MIKLKVIVMSNLPYSVNTIVNVSNIAFDGVSYKITSGTTTTTYNAEQYSIMIAK